MIAKKIILLLTIIICVFANTNAQQPSSHQKNNTLQFDVQKVEVEGNFLNSHVNYAYQDKLGFMWFATVNGLCRYDGVEILKFTTTK